MTRDDDRYGVRSAPDGIRLTVASATVSQDAVASAVADLPSLQFGQRAGIA
jgi:hypothetical protein